MSDAGSTVRRARFGWFFQQDWFLAIALAFFVGVLVWFGRQIGDFFQPSAKEVSAPTLVGQTAGDAERTAERSHVQAVVVAHQPSDRYPKDLVIRQDPPGGSLVRSGRQISIVISSGVQIFSMPDLRSDTMREVGLDLSHFKLLLGKTKLVESDDVPANRVVSQDPPPLSSVRVGTTVNLELSKGGKSAGRVPNFVNLNVEEARELARKQRVKLGQIVWTPFGRWGMPRGSIVRQSPSAGTPLEPGGDVSLQVSAGPRESGYLVRQVHATAVVPDNQTDPTRAQAVRVQVRDETGTWNVYDTFATPKQRLNFNLTVIGTAELEMYVNNELLSSSRLGTEPAMQERQQMGPAPATVGPIKPAAKRSP
ncbi:MAG: PASTA domain-containing protein [Candidatus Eremiobacteraeota bacterium]|nr:PASTA domain-containing protein [Candidatus Eremiobacteraeota bacterium]